MFGFRLLAYALLAYTAFWVAAYRGLWYDSHVFARKSSAFEFDVGDFSVSGMPYIQIGDVLPKLRNTAVVGANTKTAHFWSAIDKSLPTPCQRHPFGFCWSLFLLYRSLCKVALKIGLGGVLYYVTYGGVTANAFVLCFCL